MVPGGSRRSLSRWTKFGPRKLAVLAEGECYRARFLPARQPSERLIPLYPECLVLVVLADGQAALALRLDETETPISPTVH